ncbi:IclR family transcriptional regulator [Amycolatopsis pithecellobii]|uniref:Glycerol operon regulatory protein n=1 Tax=Amycolatopsis pithecellobii TaxID=664692 RepID=A0A6N7YM54_9PSEU|nr:IclR family transcriptional regulator [Amycolatopsis pithecellobii]MTD54037.1 helix-turn-helix domain-containing protein [Amycolatopsis pithecellobii]
MSNNSEVRSNAVQSVQRAVSILQVLARDGTSGVSDIAAQLDVHKSTVFRLIATLEARGLVEQVADRGQYQLGYGVVQLAAGVTRRHDIAIVSRATCQELAERVGETVNIVIRDGQEVLTVDQVIGSAAVTTMNWAGQRSPVHATAAGKVFLAAMPATERDSLMAKPLTRYTEHTLVDREALEAQVSTVTREGYGYTIEELEVGLVSVAAPIRDLDGDVVAALTVSGPIFRINAGTMMDIAPAVIAAAATISERNGYPKPG